MGDYEDMFGPPTYCSPNQSVELCHVSAHAQSRAAGGGGQGVTEILHTENRYNQHIILVSTPQNRTNSAFPACDSTGQYGHFTRLGIGADR